ncbi:MULTISPECIES: DsrE family protein [Thiomicrorhabdus]|uniref:DsrE family protein n=1 Tax=Thiomicrorhabdus heinhorstiae TaxID=2748010 RepID=A0ABS0BYH9_9GAMM|nr:MULTISPECIES: DsrE family protein [Thiomicrorhabdus]MBF6058856.1 DsrE family protein [Thiomicrorhabdus heinhorstiae]
MNSPGLTFIKIFFALLILSFSIPSHAEELNNKEALKGIKSMNVIYDIRKSNPNAMLIYLKGIESNRTNLIKEGVEPHQRIIFIAKSVKFITTKPSQDVEVEYEDVLKKVAVQIQRLVDLGVKMEVCSAATAAFNVDNDTLLPGIKPVRSGFLSVMGWQAQGYQLVPVYD